MPYAPEAGRLVGLEAGRLDGPEAERLAGLGAERLAGMIRRRDPLFRRIYEFNLLPSRYLHASWVEALFEPGLWRRLAAMPRCEAPLCRLILEKTDLAGSFHDDFDDAPARLALLDHAVLERLALHAGLLREGAAVRAAIGRDRVLALRAALGEEAYAFALHRAPLLAPPVPGLPDGPGGDMAPEELRRRAGQAGWRLVMAVASGFPPALRRRFALKLPRGAADAEPGAPQAEPGRAATTLIRVLKETEPRWATLFAPKTA